MNNKFGRKNHCDDDILKTEIFCCWVAHQLKQVPRYQWKKTFRDLTDGRDDIAEIRRLVWEVINRGEEK